MGCSFVAVAPKELWCRVNCGAGRRIEDPAATYLPGLATGTGGVGGAGGGGTRDNGGIGGPGCTGGPGGTGPTDSEEKTNFLDNTLCAAQYVRKHVARAHSLSGSAADSL
jgi:hypothetical protein